MSIIGGYRQVGVPLTLAPLPPWWYPRLAVGSSPDTCRNDDSLIDKERSHEESHSCCTRLHLRGASAGRARQAWNQAERVFDHAEQAEQALARIKAALALRRPDGQLNDRAWAQQQITDTIGELEGDEWGKVRRLLGDVRTLNHLDWMHEQLAHAVPEPLLREAVTRLR